MKTLTRKDARNVALGRGEIAQNAARAELLVDQTHPFFYDHPLDHVPGILLIEGALQLARAWSAAAVPEPARLESVRVDFRRYCLHGAPITAELDATDPRRPQVRLVQDGTTRAEIGLSLACPRADARRAPPSDEAGDARCGFDAGWRSELSEAARLEPLAPAEAEALNKVNPVNVMIAQPRRLARGYWSSLLPAEAGNLLVDPVDAPEWHPLTLLEAFMQVLRFRNRRDPEAGRMRDILQGIDLDIVRPARREESLWLFCAEEARIERRRLVRSGCIATRTEIVARIAIRTARAQTRPTPLDREPALAEGTN